MHKVLIRPLDISDAKTSWKWRNNPEIWDFTGSKPNQKITYEIEHEWIQKVIADQSTKRFAILVNDIYVGNIQLTDIEIDETAEFHIFIGDTSYWGKGVGKLATYQILHYAKEELNLKNIFLKVRKENISAINVYTKNGFEITDEEEGWLKMNCNILDLNIPMVSVFVMVYNHEEFLKECLDGLLIQKCSFNFNIVVGEDCSTDNSRAILLDYQLEYPGKFKLLLHKENVGAVKNQELVFKNCSGRYIALCEGDDYWTDPLKLQKQVSFLEKNPDYSLCFHGAKVLEQPRCKFLFNARRHFGNKTFSSSSVIKGGGSFVPTCSMVFPRKIIENLPSWFFNAPIGDLFLSINCAMAGKVYYFDKLMSVYNVTTSNWSANIIGDVNFRKRFDFRMKIIELLKRTNVETSNRYDNEINHLITANIKALLTDKYDNQFELQSKTQFFNQLNFVDKIDVNLMNLIPIVPRLYKKGFNLFKFIF